MSRRGTSACLHLVVFALGILVLVTTNVTDSKRPCLLFVVLNVFVAGCSIFAILWTVRRTDTLPFVVYNVYAGFLLVGLWSCTGCSRLAPVLTGPWLLATALLNWIFISRFWATILTGAYVLLFCAITTYELVQLDATQGDCKFVEESTWLLRSFFLGNPLLILVLVFVHVFVRNKGKKVSGRDREPVAFEPSFSSEPRSEGEEVHDMSAVQVAGRLAERQLRSATSAHVTASYENVTVLVAGVSDFVERTKEVSAKELVNQINQIFSAFDVLAGQKGVQKIKTCGDQYFCVSFPSQLRLSFEEPERKSPNVGSSCHIDRAISMCLSMHQTTYPMTIGTQPVRLRVGAATGCVITGVIGFNCLSLDIWGEVVNTACQLKDCVDLKDQTGVVAICPHTASYLSEQQYSLSPVHKQGQPSHWLAEDKAKLKRVWTLQEICDTDITEADFHSCAIPSIRSTPDTDFKSGFTAKPLKNKVKASQSCSQLPVLEGIAFSNPVVPPGTASMPRWDVR